MTVSYAAEVARCTGFGCFPKLLLRWRASIYKLIWVDLVVYLFIYYSLSFTYCFILNEEQKKTYEVVVKYCNNSISLIPLMFVLGFYVSIVIKRWWAQYMTLPWPDSTAVYVSSLIRGQDENGRKMRRTIMRYVCLSLTMVLTIMSPRVKKRFPTLNHLIDMGLLVENEKEILNAMNQKFAKHPKHWMPIVWASSIVTRARKEGRIRDDSSIKTLIDSLNSFQSKCMSLTFYDTISIPLVYTQVVTIAVYTYFLASLVGRQWTARTNIEAKMNIVDYFPIFLILEFMFFMGWLKVAESLICPFGEDDDDFELNWMIDRNLQVSYLIVDEMHNEHPDLLKDQFWHRVLPPDISNSKNDENSTKKSFFNVPIVESITYLFLRNGGRPRTQAPSSATENLETINSALKDFLDSQPVQTSLDPENISDNVKNSVVQKPSKMVQIRGETSSKISLTTEQDQDEFELLKQRRLQERAERQNYLLAVPTSMDTVTEAEVQTSLRSSLSSLSNEEEQVSKMEENKKDV